MFERFLNKISTPTVIRVLVSRGGKPSLCKGLARRLFLREIPCVRYNNYKALLGSFRREADGKERRAITFLSRRAGTGKVFSRSLPDEEEVGRATVRIVSRKPRLLAKLRGYRYHREARISCGISSGYSATDAATCSTTSRDNDLQRGVRRSEMRSIAALFYAIFETLGDTHGAEIRAAHRTIFAVVFRSLFVVGQSRFGIE